LANSISDLEVIPAASEDHPPNRPSEALFARPSEVSKEEDLSTTFHYELATTKIIGKDQEKYVEEDEDDDPNDGDDGEEEPFPLFAPAVDLHSAHPHGVAEDFMLPEPAQCSVAPSAAPVLQPLHKEDRASFIKEPLSAADDESMVQSREKLAPEDLPLVQEEPSSSEGPTPEKKQALSRSSPSHYLRNDLSSKKEFHTGADPSLTEVIKSDDEESDIQ